MQFLKARIACGQPGRPSTHPGEDGEVRLELFRECWGVSSCMESFLHWEINLVSLNVCNDANDEVWNSLGGWFHQKFLFRPAEGLMIDLSHFVKSILIFARTPLCLVVVGWLVVTAMVMVMVCSSRYFHFHWTLVRYHSQHSIKIRCFLSSGTSNKWLRVSQTVSEYE